MHSTTIGILESKEGQVCDFAHAERIVLIAQEDQTRTWTRQTCVPIRRSGQTPEEIRSDIRVLISELGDCRVVAGTEVLGLPFGVFDRMGFSIFSIVEASDTVLDGIVDDIAQSDALNRMRREIIEQARPVPTDVPGVYYLDLVLLHTECPEVSSKKAMTDFLRNTPFLELHLICRHTPPWLATFPVAVAESQETDGNVHCVITPARCG